MDACELCYGLDGEIDDGDSLTTELIQLPCSHILCKKCLIEYYESHKINKYYAKCPLSDCYRSWKYSDYFEFEYAENKISKKIYQKVLCPKPIYPKPLCPKTAFNIEEEIRLSNNTLTETFSETYPIPKNRCLNCAMEKPLNVYQYCDKCFREVLNLYYQKQQFHYYQPIKD